MIPTSTSALPSRPRLYTLDALRGVAAFIVIWYHVFEGFATSPADQMLNHGYLAVDFFFLLSGYVIGYSYDHRWGNGTLTGREFLKRRLIRLHPMVVAGVLLGVAAFLLAGSKQWDGTVISLSMVIAACCLNIFMLPVLPGPGPDVRGNGEMFPLNGPHWSLFFEYIANFTYALFVRRLSTKGLWVLTILSGCALAFIGIGNLSGYGHLGIGWTLADNNLWGGLARVMFSFTAGLLMSRTLRRRRLPYAFLWCTLILIAVTCIPHAGTPEARWINGIYDTVAVTVIFPLVLAMGASAIDENTGRFKKLAGDISYPMYAIHYPLMYMFYAWVWANGLSFSETWHVAVAIVFSSIILAWLLLVGYDRPVRRYLAKHYLKRS